MNKYKQRRNKIYKNNKKTPTHEHQISKITRIGNKIKPIRTTQSMYSPSNDSRVHQEQGEEKGSSDRGGRHLGTRHGWTGNEEQVSTGVARWTARRRVTARWARAHH